MPAGENLPFESPIYIGGKEIMAKNLNIEEMSFDEKVGHYTDSFSGKLNVEEAKSGISIREALTTNDANILVPKTIQQVTTAAAQAKYLATKYFKRINLNEGRSMEFIHFGAIRAEEIAEGMEYPEQLLNLTKSGIGPVEVRVRKYGLKVSITDEMIDESQWDVVGLHLEAAGQAMARLKEQNAFSAFSRHGHVVFDAKMFEPGQDGYPTGRGFNGELNGTLTAEDMLDMAVSVMSAGFTPTTIIMHPLTWSLFAKNEFLMNSVKHNAAFGQGTNGQDPREVSTSNSLGLSVEFSPFVPFDQANKTFDFYLIDEDNVGVMVVKEDISTEQFDDPTRDIKNLKIKERYGLGILNGGLGIAVARNIAFKKTYPMPEREFERMTLPEDMKDAKHDEI